jgi:hypothetical protein
MNLIEVDVCPHQRRIRRGPGPDRRGPNRILKDLFVRYKTNVWEGLAHRTESVIDSQGNEIWAELLITHKSLSVDTVLGWMIEKGTTFNLFALGIMRAFAAAKRWWVWYKSVNAYVADITHPDFRFLITKLMPFYTKKEQSDVVIELLEYRHGNLNGEYINNIKWLRKMWFRIKIDDCDILWIDKNGVSMEIFEAVGSECEWIKIDHRTSNEITEWGLSIAFKNRLWKRVKSLLSGKQSITAEWIRSSTDIWELWRTLWVTKFQLAPEQYRKRKEK